MPTNSTPMKRPIKSYVIRAGRMTDAQKQAIKTHFTTYGLDHLSKPWDLQKIFPQAGPHILEIGFGMGQSLFAMAQRFPHENFIGVEVHPPGVGVLLTKIADAQLTNLRISAQDAKEVLTQAIPDGSLARVQIFFPDPWPKARHHKRRLIQPEFIQLLWKKLQNQGILHIATDWKPYADHILEVMAQVPGFQNRAECGTFVQKPDYRPSTKYEERGQRLGHQVFDLVFTREL